MTLLRRVRWGVALMVAALLLWSALAPLHASTRERDLDFPRRGGMVPAALTLTLGVRDVLLLRNRDAAPHVFGQVSVLPGHLLRLPFEQAGDYPFACDVAPGKTVTVQVVEHPDPGWPRLRWRLAALADAVRALPLLGPDD